MDAGQNPVPVEINYLEEAVRRLGDRVARDPVEWRPEWNDEDRAEIESLRAENSPSLLTKFVLCFLILAGFFLAFLAK